MCPLGCLPLYEGWTGGGGLQGPVPLRKGSRRQWVGGGSGEMEDTNFRRFYPQVTPF